MPKRITFSQLTWTPGIGVLHISPSGSDLAEKRTAPGEDRFRRGNAAAMIPVEKADYELDCGSVLQVPFVPKPPGMNGGDDGARTRDLCRDRAAL